MIDSGLSELQVMRIKKRRSACQDAKISEACRMGGEYCSQGSAHPKQSNRSCQGEEEERNVRKRKASGPVTKERKTGNALLRGRVRPMTRGDV